VIFVDIAYFLLKEMNELSEVKVYYLSKEELEKVRWGAKCDLDQRPRRIGHVDWKWRNVKRRKQLAQK